MSDNPNPAGGTTEEVLDQPPPETEARRKQRLRREGSRKLDLEDVLLEEFVRLHPAEYLEHLQQHGTPLERDPDVRKALLGELLSRGERVALCLSGGGIRSASFCLGVLRGLARQGLLERLDYLSTVSGGGYIGSWLAAWAYRHKKDLSGVLEELGKQAEPDSVQHLRQYSSYLSPRTGLFSLDSWVLAGTFLRNLLLNWTILVPLLLALPLFVMTLSEAVKSGNVLVLEAQQTAVLQAVQVVLGTCATWFILHHRPGWEGSRRRRREAAVARRKRRQPVAGGRRRATGWAVDKRALWIRCVAPLFGASILYGLLLAPALVVQDPIREWISFKAGLPVLAFGPVAWLAASRLALQFTDRVRLLDFFSLILASAISWGLLFLASDFLLGLSWPAGVLTLWPPAFLGCYLIGATLYVGFASKITTKDDREWFAACGSRILGSSLAWMALFGLVLIVPAWLEDWKTQVSTGSGLSGLLAVLLGRDASTPSDAKSENLTRAAGLLQKVPILAAGLCCILALPSVSWIVGALLKSWKMVGLPWVLVSLVLMLAVASFMAVVVDINKFSLHAMYRERLLRCFLGASRTSGRRPNPVTGFDADDDLELYRLQREYFRPEDKPRKKPSPNGSAPAQLLVDQVRATSLQQREFESGILNKALDADDLTRELPAAERLATWTSAVAALLKERGVEEPRTGSLAAFVAERATRGPVVPYLLRPLLPIVNRLALERHSGYTFPCREGPTSGCKPFLVVNTTINLVGGTRVRQLRPQSGHSSRSGFSVLSAFALPGHRQNREKA